MKLAGRPGRTSHDHVTFADVVIVGAGIAGLSAGLALAPRRVHVVTKAAFGQGGSTPHAQGGIAAAVGDDDTPELHARDTMAASAGLAVREVVDVLTTEGPRQIERLLALGARFDRDGAGELALGREAAHSRRRILHAHGDSTGAEVVRALVAAAHRSPELYVFEHAFAVDIVTDGVRAIGVSAVDEQGRTTLHLARAVVLASGGMGQLYAHTTNPVEATGDGLAIAARAGVQLADVEFVQFHPTALVGKGDPQPLLTEALRGEGAVLVNEEGRRFMPEVHPDAELAPRDVVARAIWGQLAAGHTVFLDARDAVGTRFPERFPTVWRLCQENGLDPRVEPMPVSPAAHYHMGGIDVDASGRASLPGLWACGEVASTGVHGANRLASNSLLEGLVFGARVAADIAGTPLAMPTRTVPVERLVRHRVDTEGERRLRRTLREVMWSDVGLVRSEESLQRALGAFAALREVCPAEAGELHNMLLAGELVARAALLRQESRGGHYRSDFPESSPGLGVRHRFVAAE